MEESELFKKGLEIRKEVLGKEYVESSLKGADDFNDVIQQIATEWGWGTAWARPGISKKTRSMMNLAMLTGLGKTKELKIHVKGAIHNGCTKQEIKEALIHATVYCGIPAGMEAFRVAHEALEEEGVL